MQLQQYMLTSSIEATSVLSHQWSRHRLRPQNETDFRLTFRKRSISKTVSINSLTYGTDVRIEPEQRDPVLLLKMPCRGRAVATFPRHELLIDPSNYAIIDVRSVSSVRWAADCQMLVLRIALSRLNSYLENLLGARPKKELQFSPEIARGSNAWISWQPIHAALQSLNDSESLSVSSRILGPLEELILSGLLSSQPNSYLEEVNRPAASIAPRHVRIAEQYIREHASEVITTELLANLAGVSIRALFDGFKSFRGTTPAEYVRSVRLEHARTDLLAGDGRVSDVALRWGFNHVGNFAAHYRRRYGEMPSRTLQSQN